MSAASRSRLSASGAGEYVVALFLLLALLVLVGLHLRGIPGSEAAATLPFDLRNPMLDAQVDECVAVESESSPGDVTCIRVAEPGVVLRPDATRERLPGLGDLSRSPPYMVCELRSAPAGKGCDHPPSHTELDVYPVGGYGLPLSVLALLQSIEPKWVDRGGRNRFVYEIQMQRYDRWLPGPVILYLDPEQPVTGVVLRKDANPRHGAQDVIFTAVECR